MDEMQHDRDRAPDPLAQIIRAAGRRADPAPEHYDQVYAAARAVWTRKVRARRRRRWLAVAASIAVLGMAGLILDALLEVPAEAASVVVAEGSIESLAQGSDSWVVIGGGAAALTEGTRIRTGRDGAAALSLTEGGSLRLDANTEVVIGVEFFELAAGRLYFDSIGRPASLPIDIGTTLGTVRNVGTQFEILARTDTVRVRVRSGRVAFFESPTPDDLVAEAGDELELSREGEWARRAIAPDDAEWAWAEALATPPSSGSRSILVYLEWIARETGRQLRFEPGRVELRAEAARITGDTQGLTPRELLGVIEATSDFRYEPTDDAAIVIRTVGP